MKALVIVHLSSLDAYAQKAGLDQAFQLAERLKDAILSWDGPVYVIDQRWPRNKWSEPRWSLVLDVQLKRDIRWTYFDDSRDWALFMRHFRAQLIRDRVRDVVLGGVWYSPGKQGGSVSELFHVLKKNLHVQVDDHLVGIFSEAA